MRTLTCLALLLSSCDGDLRFVGANDAPAADTRSRPECRNDEECTNDRLRRCDVASGRCVECGLATDCNEGELCEPTTKQCMRRCGETSSCSSETPFCDPRGLCVCTATSCTSGDRHVCSPSGRCVECTNDAQCSPSEPRCDLARGECSE